MRCVCVCVCLQRLTPRPPGSNCPPFLAIPRSLNRHPPPLAPTHPPLQPPQPGALLESDFDGSIALELGGGDGDDDGDPFVKIDKAALEAVGALHALRRLRLEGAAVPAPPRCWAALTGLEELALSR